MRKLAVILLMLLQTSAFAQSFWSRVIDDFQYSKSTYTSSSLFNNSLILVSGNGYPTSCSGSGLFAYNLTGKRIWYRDGYFDVIHSDSNSIYAVGYTIGINDYGGSDQVVISKYNKNGYEIFSKGYPDIPHQSWSSFVPVSMDVNNEGSFIISSKKSVIKADSKGNVVYQKKLKLQNDMRKIQFLDANSLLISTKYRLYKTDDACNLLDSISFDNENVSGLLHDNSFYGLFPNRLIRVDTNLKIQDTILTSNEIELMQIKRFGGDFWILGKNGAKSEIIHLVNLAVSDTLSFDSLLPSSDFLVSPDNVIFTGTSNSSQIAVYSFSKKVESEQVNLPDIQILDVNFLNITIDAPSIYGGANSQGYSFTPEVLVRNVGNDTIKSFAVHFDWHGGFNCSHDSYYQKVTGISLPPGQEKSIKLDRLHEDRVMYNSFCFEVLAPNSQIETNLDKNSLCKTFVITGLNDFPKSQQYQFYPNPVKDFLNLKFEENGIKHIRLTNVNGSLLLETKITECETNLDLSEFDSGIYLLSIVSESGIITQKIVKE
jgi:hypothetical protein